MVIFPRKKGSTECLWKINLSVTAIYVYSYYRIIR